MLKKVLITCFFFIFLLTSFYTVTCYATNSTITKEELNTALQNIANEDNYKIYVENDRIKIIENDKTSYLNYDLTGKPTFSIEIPIKKGMSYKEFEEQTDKINLPIIVGYVAVANNRGVNIEVAKLNILRGFLGGVSSTANPYVIVDDINLSDGVTIVKDKDDSKTIYTSEFGERVLEYTNALYKDKQIYKDSDIDSYEWVIEKKEVTDTSCKLVSTVSVDLEADFSKISEALEENEKEMIDKNNEIINNINNGIVQEEKLPQKENTTNTTNTTKEDINSIPYAGIQINNLTKMLITTIVMAIVIIVMIYFSTKKENKK